MTAATVQSLQPLQAAILAAGRAGLADPTVTLSGPVPVLHYTSLAALEGWEEWGLIALSVGGKNVGCPDGVHCYRAVIVGAGVGADYDMHVEVAYPAPAVEPEVVEPEPVDNDAVPDAVAVRGYFDTAEWDALNPDQVAALVELCRVSGWWGDWRAAYRQVIGDTPPAIPLPRRTPGAALVAEPAPDPVHLADVRDYCGESRWSSLNMRQRAELVRRCKAVGRAASWLDIYREIVAETRTDLPIYQQRTAGSLR